MDKALCVGIAMTSRQQQLQVDVRRRGHCLAHLVLRNDEAGLRALADFLCGWDGPVRLAIAAAGIPAIAIGLALGSVPGREVFWVAAVTATQAPDLAQYAERRI